MKDIQYVGTCTCGRGIERGDDVVEINGVVYHEGCEPQAAATEPVVEQTVELPAKKGDKKMKKDEVLEKLLAMVSSLTAEVAALKSARPAAMSLVAAVPKKSKAEKGAPRPEVYYLIKGFPSEKRPPQCLKVFRAIAQAAPEGGRLTELEIWNTLMEGPHPSEQPSKNVGSWGYRQTPFYIFKYYRADMINAEYVQGPFNV